MVTGLQAWELFGYLYLGLRSRCSLRPRLNYYGPLALGRSSGETPPQPAGEHAQCH